MIQVSILNGREVVTMPVERIVTSNSTNSIYFEFNSDNYARDNEKILKTHGYKTEHTNRTIRVFNFNSFDLIIPE